jgi:hypothetical protein
MGTIAYQQGETVSYAYENGFTRDASDGSNTETEYVIPGWYIGCLVVVQKILTPYGNKWMLQNTGGRAWAKENTDVS